MRANRGHDAGQLGYVLAAWWRLYPMLYLADPASVDEPGEIHGIIDAVLEGGLPDYEKDG